MNALLGMVSKGTIFALALLLTVPVIAQDSPLAPLANQQLAEPRKEAEATGLMESLRCIQCQGQSIADSDAPIAAAMRAEVRQRVSKGESTDSIRSLMIARYGEWVSFEPAASGSGLFLWLAPLMILIAGIFISRTLFRRAK